MNYSERWEIREELGEGGQGKVYLVSNKLESLAIEEKVVQSIQQFSGISTADKRKKHYEIFRDSIIKMFELEHPSQQGALKVLHSPENARDANLAEERLKREIQAMVKHLHPNLIKILDFDTDSKWFVSEFYPNGSLSKNIDIFKGDFLKSLKAFRPLVDAVATLHQKHCIHRDIKPRNVFLDSDNNLILGDFGLVYFTDSQRTRISAKFENVGSRDWEPPWAFGIRIEDLKPTFDVFTLGKLLWAMVSGLPVLQLWYFDRDPNNLEKLFPNSPSMELANLLLGKCIVQEEKDCLPHAIALLDEVDKLLSIFEYDADILNKNIERACKVCGIGTYKLVAEGGFNQTKDWGFDPAGNRNMRIFRCRHCGNIQLFSYDGDELPEAWQE